MVFVERIAVEVDGEGDAVLMIHGLGGTTNTWTPLLGAFSRHKRVRLDLPGSGRSWRVEGPLSIEKFVEAAKRALAAAKVDKAHVVAHSMGTIVAAHLAAAEPAMVRSLALFGPLLAPPDQARANIRARAAKARQEGMRGIADALVQAVHFELKPGQRRPVAVAFVRESLMGQNPDGYARSCEALADAQAADTSPDRLPDAARHRRRGRGRAAAVGAHDGAEDFRQPRRSPARLRALDSGREVRGVHRTVEAFLYGREPDSQFGSQNYDPDPELRRARDGQRALHERSHHRRHRRAAVHRRSAGAGQPHFAHRPRQPQPAGGGRDGDRRRRRDAHARACARRTRTSAGPTPRRWTRSRSCRTRSTRCGRRRWRSSTSTTAGLPASARPRPSRASTA